MTTNHPRRTVGQRLAPFQLETLAHGTLEVPRRGWVHLRFMRFAGCPVCNLHLRRFSKEAERLRTFDITSVSFFHSPKASMLPYQAELPFPVVADPERRWFGAFGVERSITAVMNPLVWVSALGGIASGPTNPFERGGEQDGLPAEFLVDASGTIVALHYGRWADDHWSMDELLARVEQAQSSAQVTDAIRH
ncbi:MAG: AhpC/TSA family protein [Archangiaceae bacterium]|nr:AhpC/TSA family protein [Archangiaceae bacterium]